MTEPERKRAKRSTGKTAGKCTGKTAVRARAWVMTIFRDDLTPDLDPDVCPIEWPNVVWGILSLEKAPTTGRLHLQGACYYKNAVGMKRLKNDFGEGHYSIMRGTPKESEEYCSKDVTHIAGPWEIGECPCQGKRTDWDSVKEELQAGQTPSDILITHPHLAMCTAGIAALKQALLPAVPISRDVVVYYLWGLTNTGKTHRAMHSFPDAFLIRGKYLEGKSFDQYSDEATLILDEFDPAEWPLTTLNALLDKWKCPLMCRYANKYARWTRVIITSNWPPDMCYLSSTAALRATFLRRLTHVSEINSRDDVIEFS